MPGGSNLNGSGLPKTSFKSHEGTIGHPVARWGDLYIQDDKYTRWGQQQVMMLVMLTKGLQLNPTTASARADSGSVMLGYNSSSTFLEVTGGAVFLDAGLNVTASGYINFGTKKVLVVME